MSVYIVTGKLGNGKTLVSVGRIKDALFAHRKVATNLDLNLKNMFGRKAQNINLMRIPDKPTIDDLNAIGKGYDGHDYDENKFGLLVLDECGTWFNSRNWQDKTRKEVNDWFLHARKLGWHVYIIIQDISMLDSQAREAIGELLVTCRRLDKLRIPFISSFLKTLTGFNLTMPRIHRAKVTYSDGLISDVWVYRGNDLFTAYDTRQSFIASYPHGTHCVLTPWHVYGRYSIPMNWKNIMRITRVYWKRFSSPVALATGLLLGAFVMLVVKQPRLFPVAEAALTHSDPKPGNPVKALNPFNGSRFVIVGSINSDLLFQVISPDKSIVQLSQSDLQQIGFVVARTASNMAVLSYQGQTFYAFSGSHESEVVASNTPAPKQPSK